MLPEVRQITPLPGMSHFLPPLDDGVLGLWHHWSRWPHLAWAADQGSDGVASHFRWMWLGLNLTAYWGFSHGCQNDWKGTLHDLNLYGFWVLMLVVWNVASGPLQNRTRWQQLQEAWSAMCSALSAKTCPLYLDKVDAILHERGGLSSLTSEMGDVETRLWDDLRTSCPYKAGEKKCNLNRFFSSTERAKEALPQWHSSLLNLEFLALETSMLKEKPIDKIVLKAAPLNDDAARQCTNGGRPTIDDKALRNAGANAVVIGINMLSEPDHKTMVQIVLSIGASTEAWHRRQNEALRSVDKSVSWMVEQLSGDFLAHVRSTLGQLHDVDVLQRCGIQCFGFAAGGDALDEVRVVRENDFACLLADGCVGLGFRRLQRCAWAFFGWPCRCTGILGDAALRRETSEELKADLEAFEALSRLDHKPDGLVALLARSVFHQTSVKQCVEGFREANFEPTETGDLAQLIRKRSRSIISSQASEDSFNVCKNSRLTKGKKNFRRPEKSYAIVLSRQIADRVHDYLPVQSDAAIPHQAACLPPSAFSSEASDCSLPVDELATTRQKKRHGIRPSQERLRVSMLISTCIATWHAAASTRSLIMCGSRALCTSGTSCCCAIVARTSG